MKPLFYSLLPENTIKSWRFIVDTLHIRVPTGLNIDSIQSSQLHVDILSKTGWSEFLSMTLSAVKHCFLIESLAHDSGRTLVCAEYGYPKGSPNTSS
jgi:hypothetical protein